MKNASQHIKRKQSQNLEVTFGRVKKCASACKILHFPTQILKNSQYDWSKAEVPPTKCHMAFKSLA